MANGIRNPSRHPKHAGPRDHLRQHSEEEMGRELCLHGPLRLRSRHHLLGHVGLQDVLREEASAPVGEGWSLIGAEVPHRAGSTACNHPPLS